MRPSEPNEFVVAMRNAQSGVALLDLMIALAVMSMTALVIASLLSAAGRVNTRSASSNAAVNEIIQREQLRRLIEAIPLENFSNDRKHFFRGTSRELQFTVEAADKPDILERLSEVRLSITPEKEVVVRATGSDANGSTATATEIVIAREVSEFGIRYYGRTSPEQPPDWQDEWPEMAGVPLLLQITLTTSGKSRPPLVLQPARTIRQSEISLSSLLPPG